MLQTRMTGDELASTPPGVLNEALEFAAAASDLLGVEILISYGAGSVSGHRGIGGRTLFDAAADGGSAEIVHALFRTEASWHARQTRTSLTRRGERRFTWLPLAGPMVWRKPSWLTGLERTAPTPTRRRL